MVTDTTNLLQKSKKEAAALQAEPAEADVAPVVVPAVVVAPDVVVVPAASMEAAAIAQSTEANGNDNGDAQPLKMERTSSGKAVLKQAILVT